MPVKVEKIDGKYRVNQTQGRAVLTTRKQAERQARLQRALKHGWRPEESVYAKAQAVVDALLEVDQVGSVPIPASGRAYSRLKGMGGLRNKQQLYINMCRDLGNRGKSTKGFPNHDGSEYTARKEALERHRVEKTLMKGGKTRGKFKMPRNWEVGHAMKEGSGYFRGQGEQHDAPGQQHGFWPSPGGASGLKSKRL